MCKFIQIDSNSNVQFLRYFPSLEACFRKYFKYLQDDFSNYDGTNFIEFILSMFPFWWIILDSNNNFMGFVYLDNFVGNGEKLYCAELTTCFEKKAWGIYVRYSAKFFLKKCFDELGLQKIKVQIYPDNFRVKKLLKDLGFVYESTLKNETVRLGKMQDIEVYGLYRNYYYK